MSFFDALWSGLGSAAGPMGQTLGQIQEEKRLQEALDAEKSYRQSMLDFEGKQLTQEQTQFDAEQLLDREMNEAAIKERRDTASDQSRAVATTAQQRLFSEGYTGASLVEDDGFFSASPGELDQAAFEQTPEFMLNKQRNEGALRVAELTGANTLAARVAENEEELRKGQFTAASQGATTATEVLQALMNMGHSQEEAQSIIYEQLGSTEREPGMLEAIEGVPELTGFPEMLDFSPLPMDPDSTVIEGAGVTPTADSAQATQFFSPTDTTQTPAWIAGASPEAHQFPEDFSLSARFNQLADSASAANIVQQELGQTVDYLQPKDIPREQMGEIYSEVRGAKIGEAEERAKQQLLLAEQRRSSGAWSDEQYQEAVARIEQELGTSRHIYSVPKQGVYSRLGGGIG